MKSERLVSWRNERIEEQNNDFLYDFEDLLTHDREAGTGNAGVSRGAIVGTKPR